MTSSDSPACINLENVSKSFKTIRALTSINISVGTGEVRAMIGEHGAGKSTIAKIISGFVPPDSGTIRLFGVEQQSRGIPFDSIEFVQQKIDLMDNLTVSENMFMVSNDHRMRFIHNRRSLHRFTNQYLKSIGVNLEGESLVSDLKYADWVLIDILRKLYKEPKLLILDEAIEKLSHENAELVIQKLKERKKNGLSVIYITHRIDDIYTFADTVTIVKNGEVLFSEPTENIDKINLIKIGYTQLNDNNTTDRYNEDFFHLLKYNEAILRNLTVSLIVINQYGDIRIVNDTARKLLNLSNNYKNTHIHSIFNNSPALANLIENSFQKNIVQQFYYVPYQDGENKDIQLNISNIPIFDENFHIGNILLFQDITEQEKLREELVLRERLAATGLLAAGVAHEINNPLGMILNDLHFIKLKSKDTEIQERIRKLQKHISDISNVIGNLLSFSNTSDSDKGFVEVNTTIAEITHLLTFYVSSINVKLSCTVSDIECTIRFSEHELKQVLLNLVKNSIEAFEEGGTINILCRQIKSDGQNFVLIEVIDNGPGIPAENLKDIFLPFRSTKKGLGKNFGLGLSVTYSIVNKYDGTITVESEPGEGCRFLITVPQAEEPVI